MRNAIDTIHKLNIRVNSHVLFLHTGSGTEGPNGYSASFYVRGWHHNRTRCALKSRAYSGSN